MSCGSAGRSLLHIKLTVVFSPAALQLLNNNNNQQQKKPTICCDTKSQTWSKALRETN